MPATQSVKSEMQRRDTQMGKPARTFEAYGPAVPRGQVRKNFVVRPKPQVIDDTGLMPKI